MKYHSTPSTIIISIFVVLLFVGVSFFILSELNLTSPTLLVTNILFDELESIESDVGISFSSIERNLRDGINIHDIRITYKDHDLLYFENLSINRGLFYLSSYILTGSGRLGVVAENGYFELPSGILGESGMQDSSIDEDGFSLQVPEILNKYGFDLSIVDLDVSLLDTIEINNCNVNVIWNNGITGSSVKADVPSFELDQSLLNAKLSNFSLSIVEDEALMAGLVFDDLSIKVSDFDIESSKGDMTLSLSSYENIKLDDISIDLALKDSRIDSQAVYADVDEISLKASTSQGSLSLKESRLGYGSFDGLIKDIEINTSNYNDFAFLLSSTSIYENGHGLLSMEQLEADFDLENGFLRMDTPRIASGDIEMYSNSYISKAELEDLGLELTLEDGLMLALSFSADFESQNSLLDLSSLDLSLDVDSNSDDTDFLLKIDDLILPELYSPLSLSLSGEDERYTLGLSLSDDITALAEYDGDLSLNLDFNEFKLSHLGYLIDRFAPALTGYISDRTALNGAVKLELHASEKSEIGFNGPVDYDLMISDISFNDAYFNISSTMKAEFADSELAINEMDINSNWFDIVYAGSLSYSQLLPEGNFVVLSSDRTSNYLSVDLYLSDYKEYTFFSNTSLLRDTNIFGSVNFSEEKLISSEFQFNIFGNSFPLDLNLDLGSSNLALSNESIDLNVSWEDILSLSLDIDRFTLSNETPEFVPSSLSAKIYLSFDFAEQQFLLDIPYIDMNDIFRLPGSPSFHLTASGNNDEISISEIELASEDYPTLSGRGLMDIRNKSFASSFSDLSGTGKESILISVIKYEDEFVGSIRGNEILLSRLGLDGMIGNFNLAGHALKLEDFAFSGLFNAVSDDITNDFRKIYGNLYIDNERLALTDLFYSNDTISFSIPSLGFDSVSGKLGLDNGSTVLTLTHDDGPFTIDANLSFELQLPSTGSIISSVTEVISRKGRGISFSGTLESASLDEKLFAPSRSFEGEYDGSRITVNGDLLSGYFAPQEGNLDLRLNIDPLIDVRLVGDVKVDGEYDFKAEVNKIDVSFVNYIFTQPVVQFIPNHYLYGELYISPNDDGFSLRGNMSSDYAEIEVFWLPDQRVLLHDINFLVWDNDFENVLCNATVLNLNTYERTPIDIRFGIMFDDSFVYESWDLDVYIPEDEFVDYRMAMPQTNIDILGKASGHLNIFGPGEDVAISGEVIAKDSTLSLGMNPLPDWYNPTAKTDILLDVHMLDNIEFVFPLGPNPIVRANIANNSNVRFELSNGGISAGGEIPLRSGEIFYFQKYFYITEGNIELRDGAVGLDPVFNLRAVLRDFDENGEPIDIYLVLREATLNNISPTLESSPSKTVNELLSILGQSILPTTTTQSTSSVETVTSLAAASVDILQKFGFIGSGDGGIDNAIRGALSLDTFSIHSNIVANLLTDTVNLAGYSSSSPFSPMARYLDGTTLHLGKYLSPDFYLQALVHLSADRGNSKNGFAFIADDLILDTEISLEWSNPLLNVTFFTKPSNLTLFELIDNFGFTFSKRILF